jgi:hypothetical protein
MRFQRELRTSKQVLREWVRTHFSDQKLASVAAFNTDGNMGFRNPCGCLMGVTYSDHLHAGHNCNHEHYWRARREDLALTGHLATIFSSSGMGKTERAYHFLGFTAAFRNCCGDDEIRRRRFSALLRAEMRRRARLNFFTPDEVRALDATCWRADKPYNAHRSSIWMSFL